MAGKVPDHHAARREAGGIDPVGGNGMLAGQTVQQGIEIGKLDRPVDAGIRWRAGDLPVVARRFGCHQRIADLGRERAQPL